MQKSCSGRDPGSGPGVPAPGPATGPRSRGSRATKRERRAETRGDTRIARVARAAQPALSAWGQAWEGQAHLEPVPRPALDLGDHGLRSANGARRAAATRASARVARAAQPALSARGQAWEGQAHLGPAEVDRVFLARSRDELGSRRTRATKRKCAALRAAAKRASAGVALAAQPALSAWGQAWEGQAHLGRVAHSAHSV